MVNSQFGAILKMFETFFKCPLEPDTNDSCLIKVGQSLSIQVELDRYGQLLIGCRLGVLAAGRYRETLIRETLKSNESTLPSTGVFAFSPKSHQLILFLKTDPNSLTIHDISTLMPPFISKAKQWAQAIAKGETPTVAPATNAPSGLFGLISK